MNLSTRLRAALLGAVLGWTCLGTALAAEPTIVYLTRHAEKASETDQDPALTKQGAARASNIAAVLASAGIRALYSTATSRTRQTAQPLAEKLALEIQAYDAKQADALVKKIKAARQTALVVGHSNTVPGLVKLFGGKAGTDIGDLEYDRLYQLIIAPNGKVTTVLLHSVAP